MVGWRSMTAMGAGACALVALLAMPQRREVAESLPVSQAAAPVAVLAAVPDPVPEALPAAEPFTLAAAPFEPLASIAWLGVPAAPAAPPSPWPGQAPIMLTAAEAALFGGAPAVSRFTRVPLAGTDEATTAAAPAPALRGAVMPRSAAEVLAERRGLDINDVRVAIDMRPSTVTFWLGTAAQDGILRDIATSPWNADWGADTFYGVSYSYRLGRFWRDFAVDIEGGGGYRSGSTNTPELWGALYVRFDGFPWRNRLYTSFGLSTGLDWLNTLPESETGTAAQPEPNTTKILHYFSPEITFALPNHPEHEIALRYSHRSGIFGTFNGVWEGSNVLMLGYRRRL
jgi:hypothetical protein